MCRIRAERFHVRCPRTRTLPWLGRREGVAKRIAGLSRHGRIAGIARCRQREPGAVLPYHGLAVHAESVRTRDLAALLGKDGNAVPDLPVGRGRGLDPFQLQLPPVVRLDGKDRGIDPLGTAPGNEGRIAPALGDGLVDGPRSLAGHERPFHRIVAHPQHGTRDRGAGRNRQAHHGFDPPIARVLHGDGKVRVDGLRSGLDLRGEGLRLQL